MRTRVRSAFFVAALLLACLIAIARGQPTPGPAPTPRPPKESDRIKALPDEERQWLTEFAAPIILPEEKTAFLELAASYQREIFKEEFWQRREQPGLVLPLGPGYRYRYRELWDLAISKYDGWREDAGRMVLRWGEPAAILRPSCVGQDVMRDVEVWTYNNVGPNGRNAIRYIFYRPFLGAPRRLWSTADGDERPFYPLSCRKDFKSLRADCNAADLRRFAQRIDPRPPNPPERPNPNDPCGQCDDRCQVYKAWLEILARQGNSAGGMIETAKVFEPPVVSTEGLDRQKARWATTSDPRAKAIGVEGPSSASAPASPAAAPSPTATPDPKHALDHDEIRERILALEPKYRAWLDLAGPLLTQEDLSRFLQLPPTEKDKFIRDFWKRHS